MGNYLSPSIYNHSFQAGSLTWVHIGSDAAVNLNFQSEIKETFKCELTDITLSMEVIGRGLTMPDAEKDLIRKIDEMIGLSK